MAGRPGGERQAAAGGRSAERSATRPIERAPSLVDEILARLQHDILTGGLAPGQRISAAAVSRQLGVSHIPVREALRRLEADALVESSHQQGAVVTRISLTDLAEIYDLRRLIERETALRAATRYTDADVRAIERAGEALIASDPTDPSSDFWEAHRAFHRTMLAPALDPWRARVLGLLWQAAERYARLRTLVFDSPESVLADHAALIQVARERNPERIAEALIAHLDRTERMVTEGYRAAAPQSPTVD